MRVLLLFAPSRASTFFDVVDQVANKETLRQAVRNPSIFISSLFITVRLHRLRVQPLDREPPNGNEKWQVYIEASDNGGQSNNKNSLLSTVELVINLIDINDNAPTLNMVSECQIRAALRCEIRAGVNDSRSIYLFAY